MTGSLADREVTSSACQRWLHVAPEWLTYHALPRHANHVCRCLDRAMSFDASVARAHVAIGPASRLHGLMKELSFLGSRPCGSWCVGALFCSRSTLKNIVKNLGIWKNNSKHAISNVLIFEIIYWRACHLDTHSCTRKNTTMYDLHKKEKVELCFLN
jgi:hypothetical protein